MGVPMEAWSQWGLVEPQRIAEGITGNGVAHVLDDAAREAERLIKANLERGTFSGRIRAAQLEQATKGMDVLTHELFDEVGTLTRAGMYQSAQLAADQALDADLFLGMPPELVAQYSDHIYWSASDTVEKLIARNTNGFTLAQRIYANGAVGVGRATRIVERGLSLNMSAREIAKQVRGYYAADVPGGASYAAMRLARTEINNAHHHATVNTNAQKPWVVGFKWNLSKSHPKPDPCDELANHDEGLGAGGFSKENVPSKPHPQCLCYTTVLQEPEDDFIDNLVGGKYDDFVLERTAVPA